MVSRKKGKRLEISSIQLYNENTEKPGVCEVHLAKHRSGATDRVELTWVARYTKFSDKAL